MKMTVDKAWERCKTALELAVLIDAARCDAWLEANEHFAVQTLSTVWRPEIGPILLSDLVERHVGLHADSRLPDPPNDTQHYKDWLRANCFRLSKHLRVLGDNINEFSWLRREYLREHGRLVK